jgi:hypothetical protein
MEAQERNDTAGTRHVRGSRFERSVAAIIGAVFLIAGAWAFFAPASFFEAAATFEPYNVHFIRDIGAFQIGLGAVLLLAAATPATDGLVAGLFGAGVGSAAHTASHVVGRDLGGTPEVDIPFFAVLTLLLVAGGVLRYRELSPAVSQDGSAASR